MKLEELLEKHRPRGDSRFHPAGPGQLEHLNTNHLLAAAINRQLEKDRVTGVTVPAGLQITKQTAWEILAAAQRNGMRLAKTTYAARRSN